MAFIPLAAVLTSKRCIHTGQPAVHRFRGRSVCTESRALPRIVVYPPATRPTPSCGRRRHRPNALGQIGRVRGGREMNTAR